MLTPQQKIQILRELDSRVSLGFSLALATFDKKLDEISIAKKKEFEALINEMNGELKKLQLSTKDGKTPEKFVDYFTPQEIKEVVEMVVKVATPKKGKDYMTTKDKAELADLTAELVLQYIDDGTDGFDGLTPEPGKDYPTHEQMKAYVLECIERMPKNEVKEFDGMDIARKLNTTKDTVEMKVIRGLEQEMANLRLLIAKDTKKRRGGGALHGGGDIIMYYDLSHLTDNVTKSFPIPANRKIVWVGGTDAPSGQYRQTVDYTGSGTTTLTLTDQVIAPSEGATLHLQYVL